MDFPVQCHVFPSSVQLSDRYCRIMDGVLSGLGKIIMCLNLIWHQVLPKNNGRFRRALTVFMVLLVAKPTSGTLTWLKITITIEPPYGPEEGYHLSKDLADQAIKMISDQKSANPSKPWFMWYCPGANHAPHQAPKEYIDKYKGKFDEGYDAYREWVLPTDD